MRTNSDRFCFYLRDIWGRFHFCPFSFNINYEDKYKFCITFLGSLRNLRNCNSFYGTLSFSWTISIKFVEFLKFFQSHSSFYTKFIFILVLESKLKGKNRTDPKCAKGQNGTDPELPPSSQKVKNGTDPNLPFFSSCKNIIFLLW